MADAVTNKTLIDNPKEIIVHMTNISDGTGEAAVIKVDKSAIGVAADGAEADSLDLAWIRWAIQGFTSVRVLWDHTTDDVAMVLSGNGYENFLETSADSRSLPKPDPRSAGATGDVLITTAGALSGATYDITACFRKAAS
jgi:hypothetical protein